MNPDILFSIMCVAGITSGLMIAIFLIEFARYQKTRDRYLILFRMVGYAGLLDIMMQTVILTLHLHGINTDFMRSFILQATLFIEIGCIIYAVFHLFHSSVDNMRHLLYVTGVFLAIVIAYPLIYRFTMGNDGDFWDIENYSAFTETPTAITLTVLMYITVIYFGLLSVILLLKGHRQYTDLMTLFFSTDITQMKLTCAKWMGVCFSIGVLTALEIFISDHYICAVLRVFIIAGYLYTALELIHDRELLTQIETAFQYIKHERVIFPDIDTVSHPQDSGLEAVKSLLEQWSKRDDQPFMKRGITLQDLSDDLQLPMNILVEYLSIIYGVSFREWILALREEAEH